MKLREKHPQKALMLRSKLFYEDGNLWTLRASVNQIAIFKSLKILFFNFELINELSFGEKSCIFWLVTMKVWKQLYFWSQIKTGVAVVEMEGWKVFQENKGWNEKEKLNI